MRLLSVFILVLSLQVYTFTQGTMLLRQPTISTKSVVFVYANDLWKVSREGGDAIRLTSNEGAESLPHFSPDEKHIAFTAQYDGNTDVYVIPAEGGSPRRLTWHPGGDFVQGWTPTGEVLFRSGRLGHPTKTNRLFTVDLEGNIPKVLDIPRAAYGEISPDGKFIAYTPITPWDQEWRNYRGGQAMPIWIVNLESNELIRTPQPTRERHLDPVWWNQEIFYLSERDYASNIWTFNPTSGEERQITFHTKFDVKSLDACKDAIIYEQGGYLHLIGPKSVQSTQLEIHIKADLNFSRTRWEDINANQLLNPQLSPTGKRALFEHRGEIFSVPKENGTWRNLSNSPGTAERSPIWSPNGDQIAWFTDASGEYKLHVADQQGLKQKTYPLPNPTFYFQPQWSPDGKYIAYTDTDYNVWILHLESGNSVLVDTDRYAHPNRTMNPVWSPDSKWIAYSKQLDSHFKSIFVHQIDTGNRIQITDGMADAISPVWDENGEYLYFLASTNYGLNSGWLDMSSYDPNVTRNIYMVLLNKKTASPLLPKSDEEIAESEEEPKQTASIKSDTLLVQIDPIDIFNRIVPIDVPARNYLSLISGPANTILFTESIQNESGLKLFKYELDKQEKSEFLSGVNQPVSSHDRKSILFQKGNSWNIVDSKSKPKNGDGTLSMNLRIKIEPKAEYHQIFKEGWRYMRDFLYVENVHGAPWNTIYDWYSPWITHVRHRTDLNYVLDIMSGEVSIGHSYVRGGDMPDLETVSIGLLGADLIFKDGQLQIQKIYSGENWNPNLKGPLAQPGLGVKEGDYILKVNGLPVSDTNNPYSLFEGTANRVTTLLVNGTPSMQEAREIIVKPVTNENNLRTATWIENNRKKVDELSGGKLAYVYVPNTSGSGFTNFNRYYFAQQDRKGVIIDERNNGGGSAADYMIDIMSRKLFGYFNSKAGDKRPWTSPIAGIWGPKVMIINERAGSGGDLLPYMFKEAELGPLVGTRTWGGLVGTWDTPPFIDGGRFVAPRGGFFDVNGDWAVEGEGISPDIEVIQEPKLVLAGKDPQLEAAVKEAMRLLQINEFQLKPEPAPPVKWKRPKGR